jgi:phage shock protein PspC (stress-responsive transcriptional regulator)
MIAGVCSGLGYYFGIDPSLIRLVWALGTIASAFIGGIAIYALLWIVLPEEPPTAFPGGETEQPEGEA